jgi:thiamine pyrophosphate-dependent acetolactate synthase large subunit-like protein
LLHAQRPALIIGKGIRWSEPYQELQQLVNDWSIPFITSPMGQGYLPDDHPLCYNAIRGFLQSQADAVLLVGARLDWTFRFGSQLAPEAKLIQIDIHEPEIGVNVAPTVGILGDARRIFQQFVMQLKAKKNESSREDALDSWCSILSEKRAEQLSALEVQMNTDTLPMSPQRMMKEIRDFLPRDAICILDGNISMAAAQQVLRSYLPVSRLTAGSNGCMGVGVPFGIGAKLSYPERVVIVICGDTAFGFNAMEMETAIRCKVPILVIVANNDGSTGALTQKSLFPPGYERVTMFQPGIRYEQIMQAFGGYAECVAQPQQLIPALERALASGVAACINVQVDPYAPLRS